MIRRSVSIFALAAVALFGTGVARAQGGSETPRQEVSVLGTGFFTRDASGNGITQKATNAGGILAGYRFRLNHWVAAEGNYGYSRNTQNFLTSASRFGIQTNVHEVTGDLVLGVPFSVARLSPYALVGGGALVFDPTKNANSFVPGASNQARGAFLYGGGVTHLLTRNIALRLEYRGFVLHEPDFNLRGAKTNALTHIAQPAAGLVIRF